MFAVNEKYIPIFSVIAVVFLFLAIVTGINISSTKNSIYRILVKNHEEAEKLSENLSRDLEVLSRYNSTVSVKLFDQKEKIIISDIESELNEYDPRRTEYINNIDSLFYSASGEYEIIYIISEKSPLVFSVLYSAEIDLYVSDWICPELAFGSVINQLIFIVFFIIIFIIIFRKLSVSFLLFIPWISILFAWRYDLICISFCIIYLTAFLAELVLKLYIDERKIFFKKLVKKIPAFACLMVFIIAMNVLFVVFSGNPISVLTVIFSMLYDFLVIYLYFIFRVKLSNRKEKVFFRYKSIIGNEKLFIFSRRKLYDIIIIAVIAAAFIVMPSVKNRIEINIPWLQEHGKSYSAISEINDERKNGLNIVQISDYIINAVYQEYYQYGITEFLPEIGQEIAVNHFVEEQGKIKEKKEIMFIFTDSFYSDILHQIPENSAAQLFKIGTNINLVSYLPASGSVFRFFDWWQYLITALFTVIPIIIFYLTINPVFFSRVFIVFTRRNRQSA